MTQYAQTAPPCLPAPVVSVTAAGGLHVKTGIHAGLVSVFSASATVTKSVSASREYHYP